MFAVLQIGARMHYAVPTLLKRAGMLRHFYTDAVGNMGLTRTLGRVLPRRLCPAPVKRLFARRIPEELTPNDVTTAQGRAIRDGLYKHLSPSTPAPQSATDWLRRRIISEGFRGANALYCLDPGDIDVMRAAKQRGMVVVYEQVIAPQVGAIMREERARFPGLEPQDSAELVEVGTRTDREIWRLADLVIAPSEFVRTGMVDLGARTDNIALVPYGLPESWYGPLEPRPVTGRILFVGGVGLRKGNPYLADACRILAQRGVEAEFRVVGPYEAGEIASPLFMGPTYVGSVPRSQIQDEFLRADVFAFPTLAEGFALAHLEAMACGVPVVTTPNCGPAVRNGEDGFVIPPRDPVALANHLELIVSDRALRDRMSRSARTRAAEFSWAAYRTRLTTTLADLQAERLRRPPPQRPALAA